MSRPARVVSLLASGTEMVAALGVESRLVAISHECDFPPHVLDRPRASRPRFDPSGLGSAAIDRAVRSAVAEHGSVYEIDTPLLERLRPELILTQAMCEVCAVPTAGVEESVAACGLDSRILSLDAHDVAGILRSIRDVGDALGEPDAADRLRATAESRIAAVRDAIRDAQPLRVLALEWLDPVFAPAHWVPEMIEIAGGIPLLGRVGERSVQTTWSAIAALDPDVLLIMPCGYGLAASIADADRHARQLAAVAPRAIRDGRAFVVDGSSYFNRSGPRVVDGIEILAGLLHPERWPAPRPERAAVWHGPAS